MCSIPTLDAQLINLKLSGRKEQPINLLLKKSISNQTAQSQWPGAFVRFLCRPPYALEEHIYFQEGYC